METTETPSPPPETQIPSWFRKNIETAKRRSPAFVMGYFQDVDIQTSGLNLFEIEHRFDEIPDDLSPKELKKHQEGAELIKSLGFDTTRWEENQTRTPFGTFTFFQSQHDPNLFLARIIPAELNQGLVACERLAVAKDTEELTTLISQGGAEILKSAITSGQQQNTRLSLLGRISSVLRRR